MKLVRVFDAEMLIFDGLRSVTWRQYLAAMWMLCGELRSMYREWLHDEGHLIDSTMAVIRQVAVEGESLKASKQAKELAHAWNAA